MPKDNEAPSFQFYPDDFVSDGKVEAMTTEEVGAYILLICKAWREKPAATLPNDDRVLARWARLTPERWAECKAAAMAPWKLLKGDVRYVQPRLKKEHDKMLTRRRQAHESATTAATTRWANEKKMRAACVTHPSGNGSAMRTDAIPSSAPSSIPTEEEDAPHARDLEGNAVAPHSLRTPTFLAAWQRWFLYQNERYHGFHVLTQERQLAELKKIGPAAAEAAIDASITKGSKQLILDGKERNGAPRRPEAQRQDR